MDFFECDKINILSTIKSDEEIVLETVFIDEYIKDIKKNFEIAKFEHFRFFIDNLIKNVAECSLCVDKLNDKIISVFTIFFEKTNELFLKRDSLLMMISLCDYSCCICESIVDMSFLKLLCMIYYTCMELSVLVSHLFNKICSKYPKYIDNIADVIDIKYTVDLFNREKESTFLHLFINLLNSKSINVFSSAFDGILCLSEPKAEDVRLFCKIYEKIIERSDVKSHLLADHIINIMRINNYEVCVDIMNLVLMKSKNNELIEAILNSFDIYIICINTLHYVSFFNFMSNLYQTVFLYNCINIDNFLSFVSSDDFLREIKNALLNGEYKLKRDILVFIISVLEKNRDNNFNEKIIELNMVSLLFDVIDKQKESEFNLILQIIFFLLRNCENTQFEKRLFKQFMNDDIFHLEEIGKGFSVEVYEWTMIVLKKIKKLSVFYIS